MGQLEISAVWVGMELDGTLGTMMGHWGIKKG